MRVLVDRGTGKSRKLGKLSASRVMIHTCYDQLRYFRLAALLLWARLASSQLVKFSKYTGQLPRRRFLSRSNPAGLLTTTSRRKLSPREMADVLQ